MLTQLIVHSWEDVLASGDDLSTFVYALKHLDSWAPRNAFGPRVVGDE